MLPKYISIPPGVTDHGKDERECDSPDKSGFYHHRGGHEPLEEIIQQTGHSLALLGKMANRLRMRTGTAKISQSPVSVSTESIGHIASPPVHPVAHPSHHERDNHQD